MENNNATRRERFSGKTPNEIFNLVYDTRDWSSEESISGHGSSMIHTASERMRLPLLFEKYDIKRIVDVACGDFNWIKRVAGGVDYYRGTDIVERLVDSNNKKYSIPRKIEFQHNDIIDGEFINDGEFDAIIAKDVLVHFPTVDVIKVIEKFKESGIKYLFATHFYELPLNPDIIIHGQWRPMNLTKDPFNLGSPIEIIKEKSEFYNWDINDKLVKVNDKSLSLWKIN